MTVFLLDLLHDLREKRLMPIAIALVVALIAVPALLMGSAAEPAGEDPAPDPTGAAGAVKPSVIQAVEEGPRAGSSLGVFDPRDPFKSAVKAKKPQAADGVAQLVKPLAGSVPASPAAGSRGLSGPAGVDVSPGGPPPPASQGPSAIRRVTKAYTYVADVKFGQTGDERTRKGVKRLGILPNDRNPIVVFLGVSSDVKRAVFLVDSRLSQSGEGVCRPTVKSCTFLYLRDSKDRDEQFLTDEQGREYHLTLLEIRRVEVKKSARASARTSRRRVRVSAAAGAKTRVVEFPVFAPDVQR